ncbi:MAG: BON domain-containing protein [Rickettsiaceae bacterium]|nr:BON domain-containing protein [Rickettsiaceae bacterium]
MTNIIKTGVFFLSIIVSITLLNLFVSLPEALASKSNDVVKDQIIHAAVKANLLAEDDIKGTDITVSVENRIVHLKGVVETNLQAERAATVAMSVRDVEDVNTDNLKLTTGKNPLLDTLITAKVYGKIKHLMLYNQISKDNDIKVETKNGVVHLEGHSIGEIDRRLIVDSVSKINTVKSVKENIYVR